MLMEDRFSHSRQEEQNIADLREVHGTIAFSDDISPPLSRSSSRYTVHIVAEEAQQRAAVARMIFASGHHAEVYSSAEELVDHRPTAGIALVHESGRLGAPVVCSALSAHGLWLPVMAFGAHIDAGRIVSGMKAGAMDYLVGEMSAGTMLAKLEQCAIEAHAVFELRRRRAGARSALAKLSNRERQVLDLLATGLSNKEMARDLGISPRTVEIHRMKMMGKLGATSPVHAACIRADALAT